MDLGARGPDMSGQPLLDGRVTVFLFGKNAEVPPAMQLLDTLQSPDQGLRLVGREQARLVQDAHVGDGAVAVVGHEPLIEQILVARGEGEHLRVGRLLRAPQRHGCTPQGLRLRRMMALWAISRMALILMKPAESCWLNPPSISMLDSS